MPSVQEGNTGAPTWETGKGRPLQDGGEMNPTCRGDQSRLEKVRNLWMKLIKFIEDQVMVFPQVAESLGWHWC